LVKYLHLSKSNFSFNSCPLSFVEPSSSPKQKDHKTPAATPPAAANVIPSPPQPTWKDRVVNPFKRIGSGSALTVVDAALPGTSAVTGVIGVPLCLCQSGSNEVRYFNYLAI